MWTMNEWMNWTLIYHLISGWSTWSLSGSNAIYVTHPMSNHDNLARMIQVTFHTNREYVTNIQTCRDRLTEKIRGGINIIQVRNSKYAFFLPNPSILRTVGSWRLKRSRLSIPTHIAPSSLPSRHWIFLSHTLFREMHWPLWHVNSKKK